MHALVHVTGDFTSFLDAGLLDIRGRLERVVFDGEHETLEITFRPSGLKRLGQDLGIGSLPVDEETDELEVAYAK